MGEFVPLCKQHWLLSKLVQGHVPMLSRILWGRRAHGNSMCRTNVSWPLYLPSPHATDTISDADGGT